MTPPRFPLLLPLLLFVWWLPSVCPSCQPLGAGCAEPGQEYYLATGNTTNTVYVAGLFGVHQRGSSSCGNVRPAGLQQALALAYAVSTFQARHPDQLTGVPLASIVFSPCGGPQLVNVVNMEKCHTTFVSQGGIVVDPSLVMGYVGTDGPIAARGVAQFLSLEHKTLISQDSSDGTAPYNSLRSVPVDSDQVMAIKEILDELGWKYVQVVYSQDEFGESGLSRLRSVMESDGVCIVNSVGVPREASETQMDGVVESVASHDKTRAVVMYVRQAVVMQFLQAAKRNGKINGRFSLMGTTDWADNEDINAGLEDMAWGAITLGLGETDPDFEAYLDEVKPSDASVKGNMWLQNYWQEEFQCNLPGSNTYPKDCDASLTLQDRRRDRHNAYVIRAVDALLLGLEKARANLCPGVHGLCNSFINYESRWMMLADIVANVSLGSAGLPMFNPTTGARRHLQYSVYNFRREGLAGGRYEQVGTYDSVGGLRLTAAIHHYNPAGEIVTRVPASACSRSPCTVCGEEAASTTAAAMPSSTSEAVTTAGGRGGQGTVTPAESVPAPPSGFRNTGWVIALVVLAGLGLLLVIVLEIYLVSKMIGKGYREWGAMWLGQLLLLGIFLSYLVCFAFIVHSTKASCTIIRFGVGVAYAMCFAVLLVKLMIIHSSKSVGYIKGFYQLLMFLFAWVVQIAVDAQWIMLKPEPEVLPITNATTPHTYMCSVSFLDHVQSLTYVMCLIFLCVVISVKSHGIATNFREGIYIGIAVGLSVPIWIAWILVGRLSENPQFEEPAVAFGLLIIATILLLVIFLPKVHQLRTLDKRDLYATREDSVDYAGSVLTPSVYPQAAAIPVKTMPPPGVRNDQRYYVRTSTKSNLKRTPVYVVGDGVSVTNGSIAHVDTNSIYGEPATVVQSHFDSDQNALYLRHPGAPQKHLRPSSQGAGSVRSMPLSRGEVLYTLERRGGDPRSTDSVRSMPLRRVQLANGQRAGGSELGYYTARSVKSVGSARSARSVHSSTLRHPRSYVNLGAL